MSERQESFSQTEFGQAYTAEGLIESVMTLVAARSRQTVGAVDPVIVSQLSIAARSLDSSDLRDLVSHLLRDRLSRSHLVDLYIPAVARELGEFWRTDRISFADVTIGTARLQSLLPEFRAAETEEAEAPQVALVVRQGERHTLGAAVAANQLRRMGVSVQLIIGRGDSEIAAVFTDRAFDAVLISASNSENLDSLRTLVKKVRGRTSAPIVLGGTVLEQNADHCAVTGADHATIDLKEALRLCGLKTSLRSAGPSTGLE